MRRAYQKQIEQMERDNMYKQQHQHFPSQFNNNPTDPLMGGYNRSVSSFFGGAEHICDVILCMPYKRVYISLASMEKKVNIPLKVGGCWLSFFNLNWFHTP